MHQPPDELAAAGHDNLPARLDDLVGGGQHEVDALLMHQTGNEAEDRAARQRQAKLPADVIRIRALAFPVASGKRLRQLGTNPGIPAFIDAVQYPRQLRGVGAEAKQSFETAAHLRRGDLLGVGFADGGQMRGIDEASLEERYMVVELESVDVEGAFGRADPAQRVRREQPLIGEVVDGQDRGDL